jgi:glyoxylase-like metal-dependent hydrolase (beta-lactamase superfamily II)
MRGVLNRFHAGTAVLALACVALLGSCAQSLIVPAAGIKRMYVFDCGVNRTTDLARWSPGLPPNTAWEFSDNCYLIQHARGWMLWDSGLADPIAAMPDGQMGGGGAINARLAKTLAAQLAETGITPAQVTHVAFSHTHSDHVGNANYFTRATLFIQQAEYDAAFGPNAAKFGFNPALYDKLRASPTVKLNGDHDVFGDGTVVIIATPGHTPGHQSLLVRLPRTGPVVLSGDMVHYEDNWNARRVPAMNFNRDQTSQSMDKVAALLARENAALWINHDKAQSAKVAKAPGFVE